MTINELESILYDKKIPNDTYSLKGGLPSEAYCIEEKDGEWHLYYSERGIKRTLGRFEKEDAAVKAFIKEYQSGTHIII